MPKTTFVFDAYGTLFDVGAAARQQAERSTRADLREKAASLAEYWRHKQLQYSWLRAITGAHTPFWTVTQDALDWALEKTGLDGDAALREELLQLYWGLSAYPEVPEVLSALKARGHKTAILSNGSPDMLAGAVDNSGIGELLDAVISVEDVGVFKPNFQVYALVPQQMGCRVEEVMFVSSNGWDASCAAGFGFTSAWINRSGEPMDRLPWTPAHHFSTLTPLAQM